LVVGDDLFSADFSDFSDFFDDPTPQVIKKEEFFPTDYTDYTD
jgi:hypothetical protein